MSLKRLPGEVVSGETLFARVIAIAREQGMHERRATLYAALLVAAWTIARSDTSDHREFPDHCELKEFVAEARAILVAAMRAEGRWP